MKFIEPYVVIDVFVSGVAGVEILRGGLVRFTHYVEQTEPNGEVVGIINSRVVMPMEGEAEARSLCMVTVAGYQPKAQPKGH